MQSQWRRLSQIVLCRMLRSRRIRSHRARELRNPQAAGGSTGTTTAMADTEGSKLHRHPRRAIAPKYTFYIPDDQKSVPLTSGDKWRLVGVESIGGFTFTTAILAAGFEQVINGDPKYGTDSGAFGERLGAAYVRQTSQAFFTEAVGDTLLHDDPRYYAMGRNHRFLRRVIYGATRVVSTRSDDGEQRFNTRRSWAILQLPR